MQINGFCTALRGQFNHGQNMVFVAVHAARRQQPHDMHCFAGLHGLIDRCRQRWVSEEIAFFDFFIQPGQILINDAPGPQVDVPDFRVAHLTVRQANIQPGCGDKSMRLLLPQAIHHRRFGVHNGVVLLLLTVAVAVQDHQYHRFFVARHCINLVMNFKL
ncbi:hypothetical protein D3C72_1332420 [compost metagenome]